MSYETIKFMETQLFYNDLFHFRCSFNYGMKMCRFPKEYFLAYFFFYGFFLGITFYEWRTIHKEKDRELHIKNGLTIILVVIMTSILLYLSITSSTEFLNGKCLSL